MDATTTHEEKVSLLAEEDKKVFRLGILINVLVIGLIIAASFILIQCPHPNAENYAERS